MTNPHPAAANFLVIVDDENPKARKVVYVERQADQPEARKLQWDELVNECLEVEGRVTLLLFTADSNTHAARLARHEYAVGNAVARMGEEIDRHLRRGDVGWIAIRIADGGSDGELYDRWETARAAQADPERCTYLQVSPAFPWTPGMCKEHLEFAHHMQHGCLVHGAPTCHH
ncbi:hypothetical protein [Streptomyces sp. NPDC006640]|uniref:hypothetical protein n=1 Tax=unclassified Streptomyces TaxID=2593676 RepID=UPI0036D0941C